MNRSLINIAANGIKSANDFLVINIPETTAILIIGVKFTGCGINLLNERMSIKNETAMILDWNLLMVFDNTELIKKSQGFIVHNYLEYIIYF